MRACRLDGLAQFGRERHCLHAVGDFLRLLWQGDAIGNSHVCGAVEGAQFGAARIIWRGEGVGGVCVCVFFVANDNCHLLSPVIDVLCRNPTSAQVTGGPQANAVGRVAATVSQVEGPDARAQAVAPVAAGTRAQIAADVLVEIILAEQVGACGGYGGGQAEGRTHPVIARYDTGQHLRGAVAVASCDLVVAVVGAKRRGDGCAVRGDAGWAECIRGQRIAASQVGGAGAGVERIERAASERAA